MPNYVASLQKIKNPKTFQKLNKKVPCVGHRVVDLKTLGNIVAAIVGVATTAVPILFSLRPSTASDGVGLESCGLSAAEQAAFQTTASLFTASCTYNITVGPAGVTLGG